MISNTMKIITMNRFTIAVLLFVVSLNSFAQKAVFENRVVLSDSVNSRDDESAAILSADGKTLFFVRSFHAGNVGGATGNQDIWYSTRKSKDSWSAARNIGAPLNDKFHNAACGISKDGNRIYLNAIKVRSDKTVPGISVSEKKDGKWSDPKPVSTYPFPEKGFFQVFVSFDETVAIVSFEGPASMGLEDLYLVKKDASGNFAEPVSLGDKLNTQGFETSPVLSPDGKTLYFSSNGRGGQGDGDIFRTTRLDDSWLNWSVPQNLGSKINTSGFDGSFSMDSDSIGFYISGEGNSGSGDIFAINLVPPPPPPPVVVIKDTIPPPPPPVVVKEEPARVDTFSQALFEFNSVVIRDDSKEGLNTVVSRLNKNKLYKVQVEGHTDNVGPEAYNQKLSEKRANSVRQYLLAQGIPAKNIKVQGFGELNPIATNDSDEGRSQNRRVEIKYFISR